MNITYNICNIQRKQIETEVRFRLIEIYISIMLQNTCTASIKLCCIAKSIQIGVVLNN